MTSSCKWPITTIRNLRGKCTVNIRREKSNEREVGAHARPIILAFGAGLLLVHVLNRPSIALNPH